MFQFRMIQNESKCLDSYGTYANVFMTVSSRIKGVSAVVEVDDFKSLKPDHYVKCFQELINFSRIAQVVASA